MERDCYPDDKIKTKNLNSVLYRMMWFGLIWSSFRQLKFRIQDVQTVNRGICMDLWQSYTDKNIDFGWKKALINSRLIVDWLYDCKFANCENCMMDRWICYDNVKRENKSSFTNTFSLSVKQFRMSFIL